MKRILPILLTLLLAIALAPPALADVVADPWEEIYDGPDNAEELEWVSGVFYANSPNGRAISKQDPSNAFNFMSFPNGTQLYIDVQWAYEGANWGYISSYTEEGKETEYGDYGWVPMAELAPLYDNAAFMTDYADRIYPFDQAAAALQSTQFYIWAYPGSGEQYDSYMEYPLDSPSDIEFSLAYTDAEGRVWGYSPYLYGWSDIWVCITDPTNADLPAFAWREPDLYASKGGPAKSESLLSTVPIVIGLIALVAVITIVCIVIIGQRNKAAAKATQPPTEQ